MTNKKEPNEYLLSKKNYQVPVTLLDSYLVQKCKWTRKQREKTQIIKKNEKNKTEIPYTKTFFFGQPYTKDMNVTCRSLGLLDKWHNYLRTSIS